MNDHPVQVQLKRRGTSATLTAILPNGAHLELFYHHGRKEHQCTVTTPEQPPAHDPHTCPVWRETMRLSGDNLEAVTQQARKRLRCDFAPLVEAYMYYNPATLRIWPHIADDVYITCATYEPGTDTIRHEPTNVCLIAFDAQGAAYQFSDGANLVYTKQIAETIHWYNSNVKAYGDGVERKEWAAWLVGQEIRDLPGESPRKVRTIGRPDNGRAAICAFPAYYI